MSYRYKASKTFWRQFYDLPNDQKKSAREKWQTFKVDPFHPSLGTHRINYLSAHAGTTVWAVEIEYDLRVVFKIVRDVVFTIGIGDHSIYDG